MAVGSGAGTGSVTGVAAGDRASVTGSVTGAGSATVGGRGHRVGDRRRVRDGGGRGHRVGDRRRVGDGGGRGHRVSDRRRVGDGGVAVTGSVTGVGSVGRHRVRDGGGRGHRVGDRRRIGDGRLGARSRRQGAWEQERQNERQQRSANRGPAGLVPRCQGATPSYNDIHLCRLAKAPDPPRSTSLEAILPASTRRCLKISCARTGLLPVRRRVCDWRESARRLTAGAWVNVDLDVLRSEREAELTLFVARDRGEIARGRSGRAYARPLRKPPRRWRRPAGVMSPASGEDAGPGLDGLGGENAAAVGHGPGSWRMRSSLRLTCSTRRADAGVPAAARRSLSDGTRTARGGQPGVPRAPIRRARSRPGAARQGRVAGALAARSCFLDRVSRRRPRARSAVLVGRVGA